MVVVIRRGRRGAVDSRAVPHSSLGSVELRGVARSAAGPLAVEIGVGWVWVRRSGVVYGGWRWRRGAVDDRAVPHNSLGSVELRGVARSAAGPLAVEMGGLEERVEERLVVRLCLKDRELAKKMTAGFWTSAGWVVSKGS